MTHPRENSLHLQSICNFIHCSSQPALFLFLDFVKTPLWRGWKWGRQSHSHLTEVQVRGKWCATVLCVRPDIIFRGNSISIMSPRCPKDYPKIISHQSSVIRKSVYIGKNGLNLKSCQTYGYKSSFGAKKMKVLCRYLRLCLLCDHYSNSHIFGLSVHKRM